MKSEHTGSNHTSPKGRHPQGQRSDSRRRSSSRHRRRRRRINGHAVFFAVLGVLFLITILRLIIWNQGTDSGYDPNETTTEFDVEVLDYIQPLDPALLEGREDDGVTTILALGNDPLSDDRSDSGLAGLIARKTDATVYNGAFPGSTIAMKNPEYDSSYPLDGLSLYWTVASLANQNFDLMDVIVPDLDSESARKALAALKEVDMNAVDHLILFYDLQDYMGGRIVYDENNLQNLNTCYGALNASIQLVQETWPHIRIFVLSPTYGTFAQGDGTQVDPSQDDLGNGTLVDYLNWQLEASRRNGVSFLDNYYGAVTVDDTDCLTDGYHLNQEGRERVAERFAQILLPAQD